jgi:hypothetical protein
VLGELSCVISKSLLVASRRRVTKKYLQDDFACAEYQQLKLLVFPLLVEHSAALRYARVCSANVRREAGSWRA